MRLRINVLFIAEVVPRQEIFAECTIDDVCLRTERPAVSLPGSGNVFEWPDRSGLLEFSDLETNSIKLRVNFFEKVSGHEDAPIGFCEVSGRAGFECVPLQGLFGSGGPVPMAGFEVRWVADDFTATRSTSIVLRDMSSTLNEYAIIVSLSCPPIQQPLSNTALSTSKYWFSYTLCRCDVRTDPFLSARRPRFSAQVDTFRVRASPNDIQELLETCPLVVRLHSSTRGIIGICALSYKHQSAITLPFIWRRYGEEEDFGEISATMELLNSSMTYAPSVNPTSTRATSERREESGMAKDEDGLPIPPPPPPLPALPTQQQTMLPSSIPGFINAAAVIPAQNAPTPDQLRVVEESARSLAKLEAEVARMHVALEKRERELTRKEEEMKRKHHAESERLRNLAAKLAHESRKELEDAKAKAESLERQVKDLRATNHRLQQSERGLLDEIKSLRAQWAKSDLGVVERELARMTGKAEDLEERLKREREEKQALEERILVLSEEIAVLRGRPRTQPTLVPHAHSSSNLSKESATSTMKKSSTTTATLSNPSLRKSTNMRGSSTSSRFATGDQQKGGNKSTSFVVRSEESVASQNDPPKAETFFDTRGVAGYPKMENELEYLRRARENLAVSGKSDVVRIIDDELNKMQRERLGL